LFYAINSKKIQTGIDELAVSIDNLVNANKNLKEFLDKCK
jgi:hypothetical protein